MGSNYSPLMQNTLDGFSEGAGHLYLKLLEKYQGDERKAFFEADRYERSVGRMASALMAKALEIGTEQGIVGTNPNAMSDLEKFLADRWRNNFMTPTTLRTGASA